MDSRNLDILRAAQAMFMRYGFGKTTIGDIATEAGVARQTVYNAFSSKVEILRAVVRMVGDETLVEVKKFWEPLASIDQKLTAFHDLAVLKWFEALRSAPDWADLLEGLHVASSEELSAVQRSWLAAIQEMLFQYPEVQKLPEGALDEIVEFFHSASMNAKYGADDIAHLRRRLATIKTATLLLIETQSVSSSCRM